ncbi:MAG: FtsX-like permease family protein [Cyclobacteriaceae bacterium]|nr:FtsX-like permease family protein [Cyclobacteriaceae bacterium]
MKEIKPPKLAQKLFEWFCNDAAAVEDLRGDIEELFYVNIERMPVWKARLNYWMHTLSLVTSYAVKKRKKSITEFSSAEYSMDILKSYFLIATRSLAKHKFFTIINVLGLAIGMSISLLLIAMITFVSTYDDFHVNKDRIYRVVTKTNLLDNQEFARVPLPLAEKLKSEYPGIEEVIRISPDLSGEAEFDGKQIPMDGFFVDSHFLNVFSFPLLKGHATTSLEKPNSMVITEAGALRMFGNEDPMGKVIKLEKFGEFEITGVLKQLPKNSHIQFEILVPFQVLENFGQAQGFVASEKRWSGLDIYTYLLLPETFSEDDPERIVTFMNTVAKGVYSENSDFLASFYLQSLEDIVPGPDLAYEIGPVWDLPTFIFFGVLTLLILLPACFNYTNISISRALKRSKEIGLRKVVGGQRNQIFFQFVLETVIVTLLALCVSSVFFVLSRNEFTAMIAASEFLDLTLTTTTILCFVGFAVFVGLIAGAVPALYFAKLNPIQALKSTSYSKASKGSFLRQSLIVGQFALSLGFIMAVAITTKQHIATLNYNFGFDQENILDVELQGVDPNIFRNEFSKLSDIQAVSMSSGIMGALPQEPAWIQKTEEKDSIDVRQIFVDHTYLTNLNLELVAGKTFPDQQEGRERFIIVNEEFLKQFKIAHPVDALDKTVTVSGVGELTIIGVAKDFHYSDLRMPIQSFFFRYNPKMLNYANLKVTSSDMHATIAKMEAVWKTIGGEKKFEARFFDDEIEEAYSVSYSLIKICGFLGFLAITISCLGLLGMVVYATETRTREIGVRKVMGASSSTIAMLLSKDYLKLMLIATVIATPLTYFFFDVLLFGEQSYPIAIGALEIVASILLLFVLGVVTILSQTVKASKANPVDTLRYE